MNPYLILIIVAAVFLVLFYGLVGMFGSAKHNEGRADTEADVLKGSQDAQKRANEAAQRQREKDQKYL